MDGTEPINLNSTNTKCNYSTDVGTRSKKDNSQTIITKHTSAILDSSTPSGIQNSNINQTVNRPSSFPLSTKNDPPVPSRRPVMTTRSVPFVPREKPVTIPRCMSQNNPPNIDSRNVNELQVVNKLQINKRANLDSLNSSSSPAHESNTNETGILTNLPSEVNLRLYEAIAPSEKNILPLYVKCENLSVTHSSSDSSSNKAVKEGTGIEIKCQNFSLCDVMKNLQEVSKQNCETTDAADSQSTLVSPQLEISKTDADGYEKMMELNEKETSFMKDEVCGSPGCQSSKSYESRLCSPDNEEIKVAMCESNEEKIEDTSVSDDVWMKYIERPLLPLKPLQKQRSVSCTNLVQTIKGLSKRKTSGHKFLAPENTLEKSKEKCTSEANIPNVLSRKQSKESDQNFRRADNVDESFSTKDSCQSLDHYAWYHSVDAKEASKRLLSMRQNGAFLIRPACNPTSNVLHTLCVVFSGRVYKFHITNLKDGHVILGRKMKHNETFSSLLNMIKYYQIEPISIRFANQEAHVNLLITPSKQTK